VARLKRPRGVQPPTHLHGSSASTAFQPLVDTFGTVPYADLNPSVLSGVAYVLMFGMMFGDAGHGLLLLALGVAVAWAPWGWLARLRKYHWAAPFLIGAGLASMGFGFAFGEAFGPTGLVPTLWLRPLQHATTLLAVSVAIGAVLLAVSYSLGALNRFREGGIARSLVALSGIAGAALYLGLALAGAGWYFHRSAVILVGAALAVVALALGFVGLFAEAGGRASGALEAGVELFDALLRLGTNTVSFARLAAFGLTHAALCSLVWSGTSDLWNRGGVLDTTMAVIVFAVGNAFTFILEALVAGIQALRLEYYEIFSRVFTSEGREFQPWRVQVR
jgi:V/A-type H+-transporting ATPase subunit I